MAGESGAWRSNRSRLCGLRLVEPSHCQHGDRFYEGAQRSEVNGRRDPPSLQTILRCVACGYRFRSAPVFHFRKRLLSCLVDFIFWPAWLAYAIDPRFMPTIARELLAALSGSACGVAGWLMERPESVPRWHLVPVPESPRNASGLSGARYGRPHRPRGDIRLL